MGFVSWIGKNLFRLINFSFFVLGLVLLGLSIWLTVDTSGNTLTLPTGAPSGSVWAAAVYGMMGIGAVVFAVGFFGCCGAKHHSGCMLCIYILLVSVCIAIEATVAVLAIVYNSQFTSVGTTWQTQIATLDYDQYAINSTAKTTEPESYNWNLMQTEWNCCGSESYLDYVGSNFSSSTGYPVPYECCVHKPGASKTDMTMGAIQNYTMCLQEAMTVGTSFKYLNAQGCYVTAKNWISTNSTIIWATDLAFAGLELIGLLIAVCMRKNIKVSDG